MRRGARRRADPPSRAESIGSGTALIRRLSGNGMSVFARTRSDGFERPQIHHDRREVFVRHRAELFVWHDREQRAAVVADPFADRARDLIVGPRADSRFGVGREVRRGHERRPVRLERSPREFQARRNRETAVRPSSRAENGTGRTAPVRSSPGTGPVRAARLWLEIPSVNGRAFGPINGRMPTIAGRPIATTASSTAATIANTLVSRFMEGFRELSIVARRRARRAECRDERPVRIRETPAKSCRRAALTHGRRSPAAGLRSPETPG